jgi:hypothetical protein
MACGLHRSPKFTDGCTPARVVPLGLLHSDFCGWNGSVAVPSVMAVLGYLFRSGGPGRSCAASSDVQFADYLQRPRAARCLPDRTRFLLSCCCKDGRTLLLK